MLTSPGTIAALRAEDVPAAALSARVMSTYPRSTCRTACATESPTCSRARVPPAPRPRSTAAGTRSTNGRGASTPPCRPPTSSFPTTQRRAGSRGSDDPEQALEHLSARLPTVAVKLGELGAIARSGSELAAATPPPVSAIDATGAGDSSPPGSSAACWTVALSTRRCASPSPAARFRLVRSAASTLSRRSTRRSPAIAQSEARA